MNAILNIETLRMGITNLTLHKLRSLLTALGIIFGVAAVICMLSVSEGKAADEMRLIELLGTHNIIVNSVKPDETRQTSEGRSFILAYGLTSEDLACVQNLPAGVEVVAPLREVAYSVTRGGREMECSVIGATPDFFRLININLSEGTAINELHMQGQQKVCVIGEQVRRELLQFTDPIGETITVMNRSTGGIPYTVIGVLSQVMTAGAPAKGVQERNLNRDVYIPFSTADARYGSVSMRVSSGTREARKVEYSQFYVKADDIDHVIPVSRMVQRILEHHHAKADYEVRVPLERLQLAQKERRNRQLLLGFIAGISLLVGGIGIMNIMLATVTERTREIGIRRALGAKQRHITAQFLVETVVLTTIGGLIGIGLGWVGAAGINRLAGWETIVQAWTVFVSFSLSILVGIFFGLYPATRAAKLDPIVALRYE